MFFKKSKEKKSFLERLVGVETITSKKSTQEKHFVVSQEKIAPVGVGFYLRGGRELRTIRALCAELSLMSDEEWRLYANFGNNHFANWIEGVLGEKELAMRIREAQDRETMHGVFSVFLSSR